jgi:mono/diheme cytochrome c family protein
MVRSPLPVMLVLCLAVSLSAQSKSASSDSSAIARGKYLVASAAPCQDCHSPRNEKGEFLRDKWLQGAPILFKPTIPMPDWAEFAPPIAGLPGWKEADAVKFMMTGIDGQGQGRRPPMPPFRFNRADATAIVKYLKSLQPPTAAGSAK